MKYNIGIYYFINKIMHDEDEFDPVDRNYYKREYLSKAEAKKQKERAKCKHNTYWTRCSLCGETLASDFHIRHHAKENNLFTNDEDIIQNYDNNQ
jgi:hypothetical protein